MTMMLALVLWLAATKATAVEDRVTDNAACVACHPTQALQWAGSQHATAFTDEPFQSALAREPQAFCRACHAPEQDPRETSISPASALGIGCVTCHLDADAPAVSVAGHGALHQPLGCGECHEFGFPDNALRQHPLAMQRTVTEHRESPTAASGCDSCHMTRDFAGRHDHRFAVTRNPEMLERALRVEVERVAPDRLRIRLEVVGAGHAVPTGDLFRRLELGAIVLDVAHPSSPARRWLGRRFDTRVETSGIALIHEIADERVPPTGVREVFLALPEAEGHDIAWWVTHQRVAFPRGPNPASAVLEGETPMAGGVIEG